MSPRRFRVVTTVQAIVGTVLLLVAVAAIVLGSNALLLPRGPITTLGAPVDEHPAQENPGAIVCPSGEALARRPTPMPVTSTELIECPSLFDGRIVRYEGEAVGEVLLRPRRAWVHVNDDIYARRIGPVAEHRTVAGGNSGMAISMPRDDATQIIPGSFRRVGTGVGVVGTFLRTDPEDGGSPAIVATDVDILREPRAIHSKVSLRRVIVAVVLAVAVLALLVLRRRRQQRVYDG
jgi:hypothetical protein